MSANLNLSYGLNTEQELSTGIRRKSLLLGTGKCPSMGVLGEGTEIRCMVSSLRTSAFLMRSPGLPREGLCQQDSVFSFPIHSHNGPREELQTPKAPDLQVSMVSESLFSSR